MRTLKNLAIAAAMVGLVAPAQAEYYPGSTDFEGENPLADACWSNVVEAAIEVDASVADGRKILTVTNSFSDHLKNWNTWTRRGDAKSANDFARQLFRDSVASMFGGKDCK